MYSEDHEFTAIHEAGHAVCVACFPLPSQEGNWITALHKTPYPSVPFLNSSSRLIGIDIEYDEENKRPNGNTLSYQHDLSNEARLVTTLGGKVAELMARTEGNWDIIEIQSILISKEFDNTDDREMIYRLLNEINANNQTKRSLAEFVKKTFSFLKEKWGLVIQISDAVISKYDRETGKVTLLYNDLSSEIKTQLRQLENTQY